MIVLDASVWISALSPTEVRHGNSWLWLQGRFDRVDQLYVPALFLAEVSGAISWRFKDPSLAIEAINGIVGNPLVKVFDGDRSFGIHTASVAAALGLRGADATYVALANLLQATLVTWDREQLWRGSLLVETREPSTDR